MNDMKDFPATLRKSLSAETLAEALYRARCSAWQMPMEPWRAVPMQIKQAFRELAVRVIASLRPPSNGRPIDSVTGLATRLALDDEKLRKIVGRIEP